jgi:hypothetical protein
MAKKCRKSSISEWVRKNILRNLNLDSTDVRSLEEKRKKTKYIEVYSNVCSTNDFVIATSAADYLKTTFINTGNQGQATYFTIRICTNVLIIYLSIQRISKNKYAYYFQVTVQTGTLSTQDMYNITKRKTCTFNVTLLTFHLPIWQWKHKNVFCACSC